MPKSASSNLLDVIRGVTGDVRTLAVFWKITRVDGTQHFFTSWDRDVTISADTYTATNAFSRSAIGATSDLSVPITEVVGFFDDTEISESDILKNQLDGARVEVFLANPDSPGDGIMSLPGGMFGSAKNVSDGNFTIELKDISLVLEGNKLGEVRQATCRVDLGHPTRCKFPVNPPERLDSTAYSLGDYIKVAGLVADPLSFDAGIINPDFDNTADALNTNLTTFTGWTVTAGVVQRRIIGNTTNLPAAPNTGSSFLRLGGASVAAAHAIQQDVDLTLAADFIAANVDSSDVTMDFVAYRSQSHASDAGRIIVEARTSGGAFISTLYDSTAENLTVDGLWHRRAALGVTLPATTRQLRIIFSTTDHGGEESSLIDTMSARLIDANQTAGTSFQYGNKMFECTVAGTSAGTPPTFDTTVGNTTVDGTATFTTRDAFMIAGQVESLSADGLHFFVAPTAFDDARFNSGAVFNYGSLTWETGENTGWSSQVIDFTEPSVQLIFQTPFNINAGDVFKVAFGCDQLRSTCRDTFVIPGSRDFATGNVLNFRGEPDLPGRDVQFRSPDAR
jgi:hypothetical protein